LPLCLAANREKISKKNSRIAIGDETTEPKFRRQNDGTFGAVQMIRGAYGSLRTRARL
jgi:hypothetical protein